MLCVSFSIGYILVKTKTLYIMVAGQLVFTIFRYLTVGFQIGIFIHRDIYCSQASSRYPWSVHCKNQDKSAGSCETVRMGFWKHLGAPQCLTDKHWRSLDVRATPSGHSVNQYSTRSLFSEVDTVWEVYAIRPDDKVTCLDNVQSLQTIQTTQQYVRTISSNSDNSRILFERGKDFSEDRPDARSSRLDVSLVKIELRGFWKDIVEIRPDEASFRSDAQQTESNFQQFLRSLKAYKQGALGLCFVQNSTVNSIVLWEGV
jgi:hypothetical protein